MEPADLTPAPAAGAPELTLGPQTTIVLRPSRAKWIALLLGCGAFTAAGVMMIREGAAAGWFVAGAFGVGVAVAVIMLLPGSAYLKVRRDGFVFGTLVRRWHLSWTAVGPFSVAIVADREMVVFDIIDPTRLSRLAGLSTALAGANAGLPDTYGLKAGELAAVLNAARDRALARANQAG